MSGTDIKPAFQAEKVTGRFTRTVMQIQEDVREVGALKDKKIITRKLVPVTEEFTEGYMIYFPMKHSLFVAADDVEQLRRIGVLETPPLVDMNSGEIVPESYSLSPKEMVQQAEIRSKGKTGGFTALDQGVIE